MNCENYQEQFVEFILCELSRSQELAIQRHLQSGCVACNSEFLAIREGTELLFSVAPQAELSQANRDAILNRALATTSDPGFQPAKYERSLSPVTAVSGRDGRRQTLQGLLALVAGFALVLAIPAASQIEPVSTAFDIGVGGGADRGLGGVLPAPDVRPNFVSFENVSQLAQPENLRVSGFLLLDTRAGEIHLLGRQLGPVLAGPSALDLEIVTASGKVHYPLSFNSSGFCKQLVPFPQEPILKIEIVSSTLSGKEAARPTNSRLVY
ncbi:MAG: hypothetical protein ABI557_02145 [Aureliella sp.]